MNDMSQENKLDLFAAGVCSAIEGHGLSEKDAAAFVAHVCKEAAARRMRWDEDDEDEGSTWWSRNKHWALPTAIGAGAFLLGADAGRNGRPDRSYISNTGSLLWERVKALLGIPDSNLWRTVTETTPTPAADATPPAGESLGLKHLTDLKALGAQ